MNLTWGMSLYGPLKALFKKKNCNSVINSRSNYDTLNVLNIRPTLGYVTIVRKYNPGEHLILGCCSLVLAEPLSRNLV